MGWIMGPWSAIGAHANGAAFVMLEGSPDYPDDQRLWRAVRDHGVTTLGVSPTLMRTLQARGASPTNGMGSLRVVASAAESDRFKAVEQSQVGDRQTALAHRPPPTAPSPRSTAGARYAPAEGASLGEPPRFVVQVCGASGLAPAGPAT
jgi:hypothetical protein